MIVSRTPMRISFVGGGTDLPDFYREHGGAVVSMAIDKHFYLSMHRSFQDDGFLIKYSQTEKVQRVGEIRHPIIRQVFTDWGITGVDFSSAADIPAGTGLGSSSAFTSGLIALCNAYLGRYESNERIAELACRVEIDKLGAPIGKQDQYGCAVGGLKSIEFLPDESVVVSPIFLAPHKKAQLERNLMMVYVGGSRSAGAMLEQQSANVRHSPALVENLKRMAAQARTLRHDLMENPDVLGEYLHEGWMRKKQLSRDISTSVVDDVYARARAAGASGGKLLGAGGAGFVLLYTPEAHHESVRRALDGFYIHCVNIDAAGTSIVYDDSSHHCGASSARRTEAPGPRAAAV